MQRILCNVVCIFLMFGSTISYSQEYRSIDGTDNNKQYPSWGASSTHIEYWTTPDYADGFNTPKLGVEFNKPNPRYISNTIFAQDGIIPDVMNLSDFAWVFGQFIDHDITLVDNSSFELLSNIVIPENDKFFTPGQFIPMLRNEAAPGTGTDIDNPRKTLNKITAFIDGSGVYGSDMTRANWLRGERGKLKVSSDNLLPWNTVDGNFNSAVDSDAPFMADDTRSLKKFFVAGDIRANENPLLIAFHTLFVREHNRMAEEMAIENPSWSDDDIYFEARKKNTAYLQSIVFNEWLPAMGVGLPTYSGYNPEINPAISNVFSAAAFRVGHTLINGTLRRMDEDGDEIALGNISLREAYFRPKLISIAGGVEPYFKGMGTQIQQHLDCKVIDDVRNFLFGAPGEGGLDLAAININRGRERGLGTYNNIRLDMGLPSISSFQALTDDAADAQLLEEIYTSIENVDPWVGMLAEKKLPGALFGELMMHVIKRQFQQLRDGDRFYYENDPSFSAEEIQKISNTSLHNILMRNTGLILMQKNLFTAMPHNAIPNGPELIPVDLAAKAYPNPTIDRVNIKIFASSEKEAKLRVMNITGQTLATQTLHLYQGENIFSFDMIGSSFPRGFYNFMIQYGGNFSVVKVIKE